MSKDEIERESRGGRLAGIAGLIGVVIFVGVGPLGLASEYSQAEDVAAGLEAFPAESSEVLVLRIVQGVAIALFVAPMLALFSAVRDRNSSFRAGLVGLAIAGPLFFAASLIASYFALDAAATAFDSASVDPGADLDDAARDVYLEQGAASVAGGLDFAGRLGLTFIMIYTSLNAMRAGLMTRFWGTLGMALGAGVLLLGTAGSAAVLAFFLAISLLVAGFWPGGRPPAWAAGEAIPWQRPGAPPSDQPDPVEESARPEDFEGTATEVDDEAGERPGRRDNKRKRKRKQRG